MATSGGFDRTVCCLPSLFHFLRSFRRRPIARLRQAAPEHSGPMDHAVAPPECVRCGNGDRAHCMRHPGERKEPHRLMGHTITWSCCGKTLSALGCEEAPRHVTWKDWDVSQETCKRCLLVQSRVFCNIHAHCMLLPSLHWQSKSHWWITGHGECRFHPERASNIPSIHRKVHQPPMSSCVINPFDMLPSNPVQLEHRPPCCKHEPQRAIEGCVTIPQHEIAN